MNFDHFQPIEPEQPPAQPEPEQSPPQQRFNYRFCPNSTNPWHECGQYCITNYWPGNRPYRLGFCPTTQHDANHRCDATCARQYGPKDQSLPENEWTHIKDPLARYMIYCIMYYGY